MAHLGYAVLVDQGNSTKADIIFDELFDVRIIGFDKNGYEAFTLDEDHFIRGETISEIKTLLDSPRKVILLAFENNHKDIDIFIDLNKIEKEHVLSMVQSYIR